MRTGDENNIGDREVLQVGKVGRSVLNTSEHIFASLQKKFSDLGRKRGHKLNTPVQPFLFHRNRIKGLSPQSGPDRATEHRKSLFREEPKNSFVNLII